MWREKRGGKYYTAQQGEGAHNCNRTVPGSALCLSRGVGCVTSVQICDYSHHLIKSHIANLLSPAKVTDYTSSLLITWSFLVALQGTSVLSWQGGLMPAPLLGDSVFVCVGLVAVPVLSD